MYNVHNETSFPLLEMSPIINSCSVSEPSCYQACEEHHHRVKFWSFPPWHRFATPPAAECWFELVWHETQGLLAVNVPFSIKGTNSLKSVIIGEGRCGQKQLLFLYGLFQIMLFICHQGNFKMCLFNIWSYACSIMSRCVVSSTLY